MTSILQLMVTLNTVLRPHRFPHLHHLLFPECSATIKNENLSVGSKNVKISIMFLISPNIGEKYEHGISGTMIEVKFLKGATWRGNFHCRREALSFSRVRFSQCPTPTWTNSLTNLAELTSTSAAVTEVALGET